MRSEAAALGGERRQNTSSLGGGEYARTNERRGVAHFAAAFDLFRKLLLYPPELRGRAFDSTLSGGIRPLDPARAEQRAELPEAGRFDLAHALAREIQALADRVERLGLPAFEAE